MAFPTNPTDGQIIELDDSIYKYHSANRVWEQLSIAHRVMYAFSGAANNTYGYDDTRLRFQMAATNANTLYKLITNAAFYGADYQAGGKVRVKVFWRDDVVSDKPSATTVDVFRCIGFNVVNKHLRHARVVGVAHDFIELELEFDAWSSPSTYELIEMNFDMIGVADRSATDSYIFYGMKNVSGVTSMGSFVKFPEVSLFEMARWA